MSVILCPPPDDDPWPTLGRQVCEWIEDNLCHGPGDLLGHPVELNDELQAWIYRIYEVEPEKTEIRKNGVISRAANPRAGRRRFSRCALSLRKGSAKTEIAAWITAVELHPDGPARSGGWQTIRGESEPIGVPVNDPYIPMISYTEEQTEELAYGALRRILENDACAIGSDFDIGLNRIMRLSGNGKAEAVAASPNARDGARTTFQHADETHRFVLPKLKDAWRVMLANLTKRPIADPWALETTTAPEPGAGSTAENTMDYALMVNAGKARNSRLFFYHRQADDKIDIEKEPGLRRAIVQASGPYIAEWTDVDRIVASFQEPGADRAYLERVWLNRLVQSSGHAFDIDLWRACRKDVEVPDGSAVALGFDGSRSDDSTALIGCHMETGHLFLLGLWECPPHLPAWEVPAVEVDGIVADAFERWWITRMYCDPPGWESRIDTWAGIYGKKRVVEWWTNRRKPMAYALRAFRSAIEAHELSQDGNADLDRHIANARKAHTNLVDEKGKPLTVVQKERHDSPKKIDAAVASVLAWEARSDALAAGEGAAPDYNITFVG